MSVEEKAIAVGDVIIELSSKELRKLNKSIFNHTKYNICPIENAIFSDLMVMDVVRKSKIEKLYHYFFG